ncbi:hypothetical protein CLPU_49c00030 [Gottschalkia purinilytica]|uniref:Nucleotide modification associated domain-containing protein n=1 Tax=Gottschalkia purinilytica TaxID=1503 RepID=A0A0L0W6T9_GOTPU|nr:DUF1599 domain-containing protein [Gottschalkia purinilytica]KNF06955.1 hypothetical protein CLPU_49c00030 [Gottschalkia purinilytica]
MIEFVEDSEEADNVYVDNNYTYVDNDKIRLHEGICKSLNHMYRAKNADYGDSFTKVREEYPNVVLIHLMEKIERLKTIDKNMTTKVDESREDTLKDIANYCIMELVEMQMENK